MTTDNQTDIVERLLTPPKCECMACCRSQCACDTEWPSSYVKEAAAEITRLRSALSTANEKNRVGYESIAQMAGKLVQLKQDLLAANSRIAELEAVVERLPKTADGVTVLPNDTVYNKAGSDLLVIAADDWCWDHCEVPEDADDAFFAIEQLGDLPPDAHETGYFHPPPIVERVCNCYSTREVALSIPSNSTAVKSKENSDE